MHSHAERGNDFEGYNDFDHPAHPVAVRVAGGSDGTDATAGKPCCYREIIAHTLNVPIALFLCI
jgi:hypothetical protein